MPSDSSVSHWIHELKAGAEGEAQQRIWEHYFDRLVALARARMGNLRAYESSQDVAASAMNSFFERARHTRFPRPDDHTELWPLLVTITVRKVASLQRRQFAGKRDARRSVSLEQIAGEEPTPEFATQVFDEGDRLLNSLEDKTLREIASLKMEAYANAEIAKRIGRSVRTVERKLTLIRKQFSEGGIPNDGR